VRILACEYIWGNHSPCPKRAFPMKTFSLPEAGRSFPHNASTFPRGAEVPQQAQAALRSGLVLQSHRLVYHSTLSSRVIKKKKKQLSAGERP